MIEAIQDGSSVRYVTLVVPSRHRANAEVLGFRRTPGGYVLRVRIGDQTERVVVDGADVSIRG